MAKQSNVTKGYIKTENMLLFMLVALAVGFVGGVVFSAFRSSPMPAGTQSAGMPAGSAPLTQQQKQTMDALVEATRSDPKNTKAWTQLGHFYFDIGQQDKAIEAYEKSLEIDDRRPDVWTDLGVMYRRNGDPDKALAAFDRAISLNQNHEIARLNKGIVLMHDKNDVKGALKAWEELLLINPQAQTPGGQPVRRMVEELKKNTPS